jgi:multiple sugar transport system ATP-binding protein
VSRVRYEAVAKQFDDVVALESFDLEVPDGCFLVLLGPSGCGKTTALRILAGLEQPNEGRVFLGDRDVTALQPRDRDVAMVFQSYALYPHMSVEDNIGYPLKVRGLGKPMRAAEVRKAAELLEIDHLLGRRPRQLSGGQRQRVALARAIVRQPAVFLMDEPLSNLDAKLRASMRGELKRLQKRLETTTLYVTHDQAEATTMADLVAVLRDGRLQQLGTPDEIYDRPANRFVATFVGNPPMNVFPVAEAGMAPPNGVAEIGVRPEDLELAATDADGSLLGEVYVVEPIGNETLVETRIGESVVTVRAERGWNRPIGTPVGVRVDPRTACFFDAQGVTQVHRTDRGLNGQRREEQQ